MIKKINGRLMLSLGTLFLASHYLFASSQCLSTPPLVDLQEKFVFIVWGLFLSLGTNPIDLPLPFA
jgi:hypothetical protein